MPSQFKFPVDLKIYAIALNGRVVESEVACGQGG